MASYHAPREWEDWSNWLAAGLHGRSRWRLPLLMLGLVFGQGRRVVAAWIRSAGLSDDFQSFYYLLQSVGRNWRELGGRVLLLVSRLVLGDQQRVLVAIDDSPTKRYGPKVQGAGICSCPRPSMRHQSRPATREAEWFPLDRAEWIMIRRRVRRGARSVTATSG